MAPLPLLAAFAAAKRYVLPAVLIGAFSLVGVQTFRLDRAQTALALEEASHGATRAALEAQAVGVAAVEVKAQQLNAAAERAAKAVQRVAVAAEKRARAIENAPTPATCQGAIELLVEAARAAE